MDWLSQTATFQTDPLVDATGQLWGTFSVNENEWPFTYQRSGPWEYYDQSNQTDAGIVCVTGPLVASFAPTPTSPNPNQMVTFDGSASSPGDYATIADYKWDFGTGTFTDDTGSTAMATNTFTKAGIYKVRLKVTDDGGYSQIATDQLTVGTVITQAPKLKSTTVKETSTGKAPIGVENPNAIAAKAQLTLTQKVSSHTVQIGSATATVPANGAHTDHRRTLPRRALLPRQPSEPPGEGSGGAVGQRDVEEQHLHRHDQEGVGPSSGAAGRLRRRVAWAARSHPRAGVKRCVSREKPAATYSPRPLRAKYHRR